MANELENTANETNTEENKTETVDTKNLEKRIRELETENNKLRQANTNASADASKWKKQYQEKLSEEERAKAQQDEANTALQQELETLRAERNIANHKAQLLSIGFGDDVAEETAKAINDQDTAKLFDGIRKFIESHDKAVQEQNLRTNPTLKGGTAPKTITKEQFDQMGYIERVKVYQEHPDLYKEFTKT